MLIDVHCHLDMLETSPEETLNLARQIGVTKLITIGTEPQDHQFVFDTAKRLYPEVYCTLGVHPHQAELWNPQVKAFILDHFSAPWVVAIGEIGLDYYYNQAPQSIQLQAFREQLELAHELNLPVQIHTRDADQDTLMVLNEFRGKVKGIIHCFTGTEALAQGCLDIGLSISISGVVTFKNAEQLRAIVKSIPLDRLLVETDSPFLAPVPHRGKKNTPAFVRDVAIQVATLKGLTLEQLAHQTTQNALQIFSKMQNKVS